jgi:hypothetical protein
MTNPVYQPQDGAIDDLSIVLINGQTVNIKNILIELSFFEDLFSFSISGYATIRDANGLIEALKLTGQEDIKINFGKVSGGINNVSITAKLYKIDNRVPEFNLTSEYYRLNFCSEDLLLSEQLKISKSYKGMVISDVVNDIVTQQLKAPNKLYVLENSSGLYDFVVPRLKPFEAISWLSTYALPEQYIGNTDVAADMLFWESKNGFNFASIRSMWESPIYNTYKYQAKNIDIDFTEQVNTILRYDFVNNFDILSQINSGAYASKIWTINPLTKQWRVHTYDYANSTAISGEKGVLNQKKNRFNKTLNEMSDSSFKVSVSNFDQKTAPYIKESGDRIGSVANDIRAEKYIPKRSAQLALLHQTVLKIAIPGDPGITAGRVVNLNLPSRIGKDQNDTSYSGKYLVTAVRHIVQSTGVYQTILEVAKESIKE